MDDSKEYQEMCRFLPFDKNWKEGDVYAAGEHTCSYFKWPKIVVGICNDECDEGGEPTRNHICGSCNRNFYAEVWKLWRQDQLQDMIGKWSVAYTLFNSYKSVPLYFENNKPYYPFNVFGSLEQCWLAFVMHEKYQKKWDGKEWVEE